MFFMSPEQYAAHMEQHRLTAEARAHDIYEFIDSLDQQQLKVFKDLMYDYSEESSAAYAVGVCAQVMRTKFNICSACGKNHDDLDPSVLLGADKPDATVPTEDVKASGGQLTDMTGWETSVQNGRPFSQMSGEELLANIPTEEQQLMDEYGMDFIEFQYPKIVCVNCGTESPNLADRMLRDPKVDGCSNCQQKAMFG